MKNLSAFTPINEDPKVVKAIETIKECRMEWEVARVAYAELALPKTKERFYEAEQALQTADEGLKKAKAEVVADRAPVLSDQLRQAVQARHELARKLVPLNEKVYAVKVEADRVLGHTQTAIPNRFWPEFRAGSGSKIEFLTELYEKEGWL